MSPPVFKLRVDRADDGNFVWVITEVDSDQSDVELAASLQCYVTPAEALREGAKVLEKLK